MATLLELCEDDGGEQLQEQQEQQERVALRAGLQSSCAHTAVCRIGKQLRWMC